MAAMTFAVRLLVLCAGLVWAGSSFAAEHLSHPSGEDHRAVHRRRPERFRGAASCRQAVAEPRSAILCRGPSGRRRQYRHDPGRPLRARRLYDPGGELELRGQSEPLRQQSLRSVQGFRTGHTGRRIGEHRARASLGSGQDGQGTDRADASQSRQICHRQCRSRHHAGACRRIVQARFQARPAQRALWRRRPGNPGRYRRSNADRFCQFDSGHAAHPRPGHCTVSP